MNDLLSNVILVGDVLTKLKELPDESIDCVVTSPPYWGLRDYGCEGQIGLEKTPEEYVAKMVAVFREVKRVLKKEGTLWLNLGDSYASQGKEGGDIDKDSGMDIERGRGRLNRHQVIKPKDLVGIPWRVAFALQQPYYTGKIKDEKDRIWLAAMIEAEGCIFIHKRKAGTPNYSTYTRQDGTTTEYDRKNDTFGAGLEVANTSEAIIKRCQAIAGIGSICSQTPEQNDSRKQTIYRWNVRSNECRWILHEIYPYLIAKMQQARLAISCPSSGENAEKAHESIINLHNGQQPTIDFDAPSSLYEQGYFLRQDIIWAKKNCMPESVTDRCTKAHEYVFLLAKSQHYFFDNEAIKEPAIHNEDTRAGYGRLHYSGKREGKSGTGQENFVQIVDNRNRRSVWTITTKPFREAHFATFPEDLVEPMIKAGCPVGGVVLDCFIGSGTTAVVAKRLGRNYIGIELNPKYARMAEVSLASMREPELMLTMMDVENGKQKTLEVKSTLPPS